MSWHDTLLDAQFRGTTFEVVSDHLKGKRALVQHGMPYRDGEDLEDLGRDARVFALRAVVYGDTYEVALQALLTAIEAPGSGELIHPIYGSLTVMVAEWEVTHDADRPDYAEIALTFLEDSPDTAFFERTFQTSEGAITTLGDSDPRDWRDQVRDLLSRVDSLVAQAQGYIGGGWVGLVEELVGLPGVGVRLAQLRSQAMGILSGLAGLANTSAPSFDPLAAPARVATEVRSLLEASVPVRTDGVVDAGALLSGVLLPRELPGANELPAQAGRAWSAILDGARRGTEPALAMTDLPTGLPDEPVTAHALGLVLLVVTEQALTVAGAISEVLDAERDDATLTPQDLDRLNAQVRALLQGAIVLHRRLYGIEQALQVIEPLRNLAAPSCRPVRAA